MHKNTKQQRQTQMWVQENSSLVTFTSNRECTCLYCI